MSDIISSRPDSRQHKNPEAFEARHRHMQLVEMKAGPRWLKVYDIPPSKDDGPDRYWRAINNVPCPRKQCTGTIRETRYHNQGITGYCVCDSCGRHFLAGGNAKAPTLVHVSKGTGMNVLRELIKLIRTRW